MVCCARTTLVLRRHVIHAVCCVNRGRDDQVVAEIETDVATRFDWIEHINASALAVAKTRFELIGGD